MAPHTQNHENGHMNGDHGRSLTTYTWDEVKKHVSRDDKWFVIDGMVYDFTRWAPRHPGGARIISHFAGQDATDVYVAMHNDKAYVSKFLRPLLVGRVEQEVSKKVALKEDFRLLRKKAEEMGLFRVNPLFFMGHLAHIFLLEVLAVWVIWQYGTGWLPFTLAAVILCTAQAQAGWTQHDYGHLSVFNQTWLNHLLHYFVIGSLKGASSHWWNFRHHQHHAKPNVIRMDPDVAATYFFLLGDKMPVKWAKLERGFMPYNWQHDYFWLLGPPLLLPVYFHIEVTYFVFKRRDWWDLFSIFLFFLRFFYVYTHFMSGWTAFGLYMFARVMESHWFTWVTQMNHIPMEVDWDQALDWVTSQTVATCNVEPSLFNDWFTGHLNFQVEHHLFPTMPRHNYIKVQPMVKELCKKHRVTYTEKPLLTAFRDILRSLRKSGELWFDAYYNG